MTAIDGVSVNTIPAHDGGYFLNPHGFKLQDYGWKKFLGIPYCKLYEFTLHPVFPLTYIDKFGNEWKPEKRFITDMGSVPRWIPPVQVLIPKDRFLIFYLHDSGYKFGGLYLNKSFKKMSRRRVDSLLLQGMIDDPEKPWPTTAASVWSGVRIGGFASFKNHGA